MGRIKRVSIITAMCLATIVGVPISKQPFRQAAAHAAPAQYAQSYRSRNTDSGYKGYRGRSSIDRGRTSPRLRQDRPYQPPRVKRDNLDRPATRSSPRHYYRRPRSAPSVSCEWMRQQAIRSGDRYWSNRYRLCESEN